METRGVTSYFAVICSNDVYNADESRLLFRGLPDHGHIFQKIDWKEGKRQRIESL